MYKGDSDFTELTLWDMWKEQSDFHSHVECHVLVLKAVSRSKGFHKPEESHSFVQSQQEVEGCEGTGKMSS